MAIKLGDAILFLAANDKELVSTLKSTEKTVDKFGKKTTSIGGEFSNMLGGWQKNLVAYGAGIFGVSQVLSFVAGEIKEAQLASQQLDAVLRSTGGAAGVTAEQVNALGDRLASLSNFSDDAIISGSSLMLTFTQIGSAVFPRAMQAALDLATAMNTDMKSAVLQVGKVLNDPIKGINALARAGIQFTESQRDAISEYIKANDLLSAQGVILAELEKQMGGSAAAAANTFTGSVQDLMDALGHLAEELEPVLNLVTRVVDGFTNMVQIVTSPIEAAKAFTGGPVVDWLFGGAAEEVNYGLAKQKNEEARKKQEENLGQDVMTAEGITRREYDAKYAAAESAAAATATAADAAAAAKKKKEEEDKKRWEVKAQAESYASMVRGDRPVGPMTMDEAAQEEREERQKFEEYRQRMKEERQRVSGDNRWAQPRSITGQRRGAGNVVISHANFTAGPDQIRAYNQRRAMMPGF